jgi:hypothetical protein
VSSTNSTSTHNCPGMGGGSSNSSSAA